MHPLPVLLDASVAYPLIRHRRITSALNPRFAVFSVSSRHFFPTRRCFTCRIRSDSAESDETGDDYFDRTVFDDFDDDSGYYCLVDEKTGSLGECGVLIEIKKLGRNARRIRSKIGVDASLDVVWNILTDYEKLADFIPGLAVSELIEKNGNCARLYQIGQQNLPLGLKFNAKGVLDCFEKELEILPYGKRREIEFKMVEGDFQLFEGKWSIEQFNKEQSDDIPVTPFKDFQTTLSYLVDVKPKLWLPVRLVEGRLSNEIKTNLSCIREEARKVILSALQDL